MGQCCKYARALNCKGCNFIYHKECKKFVVARAKDIAQELLPFLYTSKVKISSNVTWSRDQNKAKSVALKYGRRHNSRIKKYSMSQVLSLALQNEVIDCKVIYIEYKTKLVGDVDKIKGVLSSFIDSAILQGSNVAIYISPSIAFNLDYDKI